VGRSSLPLRSKLLLARYQLPEDGSSPDRALVLRLLSAEASASGPTASEGAAITRSRRLRQVAMESMGRDPEGPGHGWCEARAGMQRGDNVADPLATPTLTTPKGTAITVGKISVKLI
jgi:hypothetical protein